VYHTKEEKMMAHAYPQYWKSEEPVCTKKNLQLRAKKEEQSNEPTEKEQVETLGGQTLT